MPEFASAIQEYANTATSLEVALAIIGVLALGTALIGWIVRLTGLGRKRGRPRRTYGYGGNENLAGGDPWGMDAIVFPAGTGANEFRPEPMRFDDADEHEDKLGPITEILAGGIDDIAGTGERVVEFVRERPLEFIAGALAAGFAVGLVMPLFSGQNRTAKLLERLLEDRSEAKREADRFRQARPK